MENRNNMQMRIGNQDWQYINGLVNILGVLIPITCLAIILGQTGLITDFLLNTDFSYLKGSRFQYHHWLSQLLTWPLGLRRKKAEITHVSTLQAQHVWHDGSVLCTLVNTVVPGACREPKLHRMQTPKHGVKLVWEYLDIPEIFSPEEFNETYLNHQQEQKFIKYLEKVLETVTNYHKTMSSMRFSTDYVARGMGLVIGEQYRKSTFYAYPIPKQYQQPCDLEITIKGPSGLQGYIKIPSVLHCQQKWQQPTEYQRALYFSSKLNNISPTIQGTSFLRKLSLNPTKRPVNPDLEIDIRVKVTPTRAKISYVPPKTGIYQISLVTKENHVVGSPYSVPVEIPSSVSSLSNDSDDGSDDINGEKYVRRKKKVISRIVDFIDEKMMLRNDGTLVKIDEKKDSKESNTPLPNNSNELKDEFSNKKFYNETNGNNDDKSIFFSNTSKLKHDNSDDHHLDDITKKEMEENNVNNKDHKNVTQLSLNIINNNPMTEDIKISTTVNEKRYTNHEESRINNSTNSNISSQFTPDILNLSNNNPNSVMFIENINDDPGLLVEDIKISLENHTLITKVQDDFSTSFSTSDSNYRNSFSKKDPSKKSVPKLSINYYNDNNLVSNLRKMFEVPNLVDCEDNLLPLNSPDLVECHMKKTEITFEKESQSNQTTNENVLQKKLLKIGAISEQYDEYQLHLKNCLKHNFEQYINENKSKFIFNYNKQKTNVEINKQNSDRDQRSLVDKQKVFWQQKSQNYKQTFDKHSPKQTTVFKHDFVTNKKNPKGECTEKKCLYFKPFEGIVETNIKLFENKHCFEKYQNNFVINPKNIDIRKSKSDTSLLVNNNNHPYQISGIVSHEKINVPSVAELKIKFLEACNVSSLLADRDEDNSNFKSENKFNEQGTEAIKTSSYPDRSLLQKQKTRFQRAKKFFQNLESKQSNIDDLPLKSFNPISRSESDSCVLYETNNPSTVQEKSLKISERFLVDDLFQDILGNDKRFIGIPNKMAVIASLASLDSDSSRVEFDPGNEAEPDMDYFAGKPKKNKRKKISIPGFHEEFPHIPITEKWKVKSRTNLKTDDFISGRVLLTKSMDNLEKY